MVKNINDITYFNIKNWTKNLLYKFKNKNNYNKKVNNYG